jgi:hypothetical protein
VGWRVAYSPAARWWLDGQGDWRWGSPRRWRDDGAEQWQLRLAPGAAGADEGGEGGSKMENGSGLGGSHRGRVDGDNGKIREGSGDFGVRGRWTESREDGRGGGVLELGREGAERQRGAGRCPTLLNALSARQREKEGRGSARCHVGAGEERRGRGRGAVPREPARHSHGGSRPFGQQWAAHVARARRSRANRGGSRHAQRGGNG